MPLTDCRHRGFREKFRANLELIKLFCSTHSSGLTMDVWMWSCSQSWSWNRTRIHARHSRLPKSTKSPQKLPDAPSIQLSSPLPNAKVGPVCGKIWFSVCELIFCSSPFWPRGHQKFSSLWMIAWGLWSISWKLIRNQMSRDKMSKNSYYRFCCSH